MPASLSHILIARGASKELDNPALTDLLSRNFHAYLWGAQGPDVLMHGGYWPWHKISNIFLIGIRMHKEHINEVFNRFFHYVRRKKGTPEQEGLLAYLLGFITHHEADSVFHPYVYDTIETLKKIRRRSPRNSLHYNIEENIDVALLEWIYHETPYNFTAYHTLVTDREICQPIARMYEQTLSDFFGRPLREKEVYNAFKDMRMLQRFMYDPYGVKCETVHFLEGLTGSVSGFSYMLHRQKLDNRYDYCNFKHRVWRFEKDPERTSTEDIFELYARAVGGSVEKIAEVARRMEAGSPETDLSDLFRNISYDNGYPIEAIQEEGRKKHGTHRKFSNRP